VNTAAHSISYRLKLVGLRALMVAAAVNIWTGAPLFGVWVGSRVVASSTDLTMGVVALILVVIAAACAALIWVLSWASAVHDDLTGRKPAVRRQVPWLRSMRAERVEWEREHIELTAMERILVVCVVLAAVAFETWFFFFSPSPI
jgi:hypothetical protein